MEPTARETTHEQRLRQRQEYLAQYRALVDDHMQLARRLRDLHERYLALQSDPAVSAKERQAQTAEIVTTEGAVLRQTQHILGALQEFLREHHRLLRSPS